MDQQKNKTLLFDLGSLLVYGHCTDENPRIISYYTWSDAKLNVNESFKYNTLYDAMLNYKQVRLAHRNHQVPAGIVHLGIVTSATTQPIVPENSNVIPVDFLSKKRIK